MQLLRERPSSAKASDGRSGTLLSARSSPSLLAPLSPARASPFANGAPALTFESRLAVKHKSPDTPYPALVFYARTTGLSRNSQLAVARLGLGTASQFALLGSHCSGVQAPTQSAQALCFVRA